MKRLLFICSILICISQAAAAEDAALARNEPWPCLYIFENIEYGDPCIFGTGYFTFYCCALSGYRPIGTLLFSISLSSDNIELSNVIFPPEVVVISGGELPGDVEVAMGCVLLGWQVVFSATLFVGEAMNEAVMIGPYTGEATPISIGCDAVVEVPSCLDLLINDPTCGVVAIHESSWGAIKSLYR